jgi:riboflavin synthase
MFTGIITAVGRIRETRSAAGGVRMVIDADGLGLDDVVPGDSIAVNGVCLTAVALDGGSFTVDVSRETLSCTAGFTEGAEVNLEKALRLADRLGGHLVSGHVDGAGEVRRVETLGDNRQLVFAVPHALSRYVARKGSVAVNGVSLTVNAVEGDDFAVNLIPHTLASTNLRTLRAGDRVNIEVDMLARYIERMQEHAAGQ